MLHEGITAMITYDKIRLRAFVLLVMLWSMMAFYTQVVHADNDNNSGVKPPFTNASLYGNYAGYVIAARGGGGIGGIFRLFFDGAGNSSGTSTWNVEGEIIPIVFEGTYTVTPDGSAIGMGSGGPLGGLEFISVITKSKKIGRKRIALELVALTDGFGPADNVITLLFTRQSERLIPHYNNH
jgi:hypothetical protein